MNLRECIISQKQTSINVSLKFPQIFFRSMIQVELSNFLYFPRRVCFLFALVMRNNREYTGNKKTLNMLVHSVRYYQGGGNEAGITFFAVGHY